MSRLRIAQLANFVGPTSGGMRVAIDELGKGYVAAGAERVLVIPGQRDRLRETEHGWVAEIRAPKVSSTYRMIVEPWRAMRVLEKFGPTSVECSDKWTLTSVAGWARRRGIGSVLFSHERLSDMADDWVRGRLPVRPLVGVLNKRLARAFDVVVVTSEFSRSEWRGTGARLRKVGLGVDLETFRPGSPEPSEIGRLCYVGRMSHEKYPQLGVAAVVELHRRGVPVQLDMYGSGPDLRALQSAAGAAPVRFHGFVASRDEIAARLGAYDISLSVCPTETFGLAVLEALACGTAVVTADRGGARELVDDSCGEWGGADASGIADAVERLLARRGRELRLAARRRAEQFGWHNGVTAMLAIHEEVAGARGGVAR